VCLELSIGLSGTSPCWIPSVLAYIVAALETVPVMSYLPRSTTSQLRPAIDSLSAGPEPAAGEIHWNAY